MSEIDSYLATVIDRAGQEARDDGSAAIEAHHLLLAIAAVDEPITRRVLGLDYRGVRDALDREFAQSLAVAGAAPMAGASHPRGSIPPPGASMKLALERAFQGVSRKPVHLLLGVLQAEVGTVPRALALAGVDPERIRQALAARDGD